MRDGGTISTGQGAPIAVSEITGPRGRTFMLSPAAMGTASEVPMTIRSIPALRASFKISLATSPADTLMNSYTVGDVTLDEINRPRYPKINIAVTM